MNDGFVQVAPDSTGKKIDTQEVVRSDGVVAERQRVVVSDLDGLNNMTSILEEHTRVLRAILLVLSSMSGADVDPDNL